MGDVQTDAQAEGSRGQVEEVKGRDCLDGKGLRSAAKAVATTLGHKFNKAKKTSQLTAGKKTSVSGTRISDDDCELVRLEKELAMLQTELGFLETDRNCVECKVKVREIAFLPCGHFLMCKLCAEPVYKCPRCQKDVLATATTFLC